MRTRFATAAVLLLACKRDAPVDPGGGSDVTAIASARDAESPGVAPPREPARASDAAVPDAVAIDAVAARPAAPDAFAIASASAVPGKLLVASPKDLAALAGMRLAFFDETTQVCLGTIGTVADRETCRRGPRVAEVVDLEGDCTKAMYGVAPGTKLATLKVRAAPAALDRIAFERFGEDAQRMYNSKAALEGLREANVARHTSTRVLEREGMSSLVLAYGTIHGARSIAAFAVGGTDEAPELFEVETFEAPAPSRVVGADLDGDRNLDAVIAHASGAVYVAGGGKSVVLTCGP